MSKIADERLSRDHTGRVTSDYEPTPTEIEVCRDAICREFGNNGTDGYYIRILKAVHAAASLRAQGGVRVKPLEWEEFWNRSEAKSTVGDYIIMPRRDGAFDWRLDGVVSCWSSSSEGAKAAAQADYERRILSSLEASPAPVSEECATDGCFTPATVHFERGGVGSKYCHSCYLKVQSLAAKGGQ